MHRSTSCSRAARLGSRGEPRARGGDVRFFPHLTDVSLPRRQGRKKMGGKRSGTRCTAYAACSAFGAALRQTGALGVHGVLEPSRLERARRGRPGAKLQQKVRKT